MINVYLLWYSVLDFAVQVLFQMPMIKFENYYKYIGIRKVWDSHGGMSFNYANNMNNGTDQLSVLGDNMILQFMNCITICLISL